MEIDNENLEYLSEKEKLIGRLHTNTMIDIFQDNEGYCVRGKLPFENSNEHRIIQNNSAAILQSSSNLLFYTMGNGLDNINIAKKQLKKYFYDIKQNKIMELSQEEFDKKHTKLQQKIIRQKLLTNPLYVQLDNMIKRQNFEELMRNDRVFALQVLTHQFLPFHPRYEEIILKYNVF